MNTLSVSPEKLHELLTYCTGFARQMLDDSGDFHPFGAALARNNEVHAVGGYDGNEHPNPQDIYRLLADGFMAGAQDGSLLAAALAANVNIPGEYESPSRDGVRIHLECAGFSRFIYIPYKITRKGLFKKSISTEFFESFAVEIQPALFAEAKDA